MVSQEEGLYTCGFQGGELGLPGKMKPHDARDGVPSLEYEGRRFRRPLLCQERRAVDQPAEEDRGLVRLEGDGQELAVEVPQKEDGYP